MIVLDIHLIFNVYGKTVWLTKAFQQNFLLKMVYMKVFSRPILADQYHTHHNQILNDNKNKNQFDQTIFYLSDTSCFFNPFSNFNDEKQRTSFIRNKVQVDKIVMFNLKNKKKIILTVSLPQTVLLIHL